MGNYTTTISGIAVNSGVNGNLTCTLDGYVTDQKFEDTIAELKKTPEVPMTTRTMLAVKKGDIYVKHFKDGFFKSERKLMPEISDVNVYGSTVVVSFEDNTKTSAVLDSEDIFSLEQGVSICLTKKLLGEDGHSIYNKLIEHGFKVIKDKKKAAEAAEKNKIAEKQARALKKARSERRKAKKREETINLHAEAYKRAMTYIFSGKAN